MAGGWRLECLEDWRLEGTTGEKGSLGWKMGAWGLENWSLGVQNDAWHLQIGGKMGPGQSKSGLGGSRDLQNWLLDVLEGGLEDSGLVWTAILGVQGPVWTSSWGHLGAPGGVSGAILEGFGGPKRAQGSHLGFPWPPQEAFRGPFWRIRGSQTKPER